MADDILDLGEFMQLPPHRPSPDYSWLLIAVDRDGTGTILDAAQGFWDTDMLADGMDCDDVGVYLPWMPPIGPRPARPTPGLYRLTAVRISGGDLIQSPNGDDYTDIEISGTWEFIAGNDMEGKPLEIIME